MLIHPLPAATWSSALGGRTCTSSPGSPPTGHPTPAHRHPSRHGYCREGLRRLSSEFRLRHRSRRVTSGDDRGSGVRRWQNSTDILAPSPEDRELSLLSPTMVPRQVGSSQSELEHVLHDLRALLGASLQALLKPMRRQSPPVRGQDPNISVVTGYLWFLIAETFLGWWPISGHSDHFLIGQQMRASYPRRPGQVTFPSWTCWPGTGWWWWWLSSQKFSANVVSLHPFKKLKFQPVRHADCRAL